MNEIEAAERVNILKRELHKLNETDPTFELKKNALVSRIVIRGLIEQFTAHEAELLTFPCGSGR